MRGTPADVLALDMDDASRASAALYLGQAQRATALVIEAPQRFVQPRTLADCGRVGRISHPQSPLRLGQRADEFS